MLSAEFLPFALVHFITFAILIYESSARQIFDFTVFPEKPTSCQFFTFLSHISLLKHNAATYFYKPNDAVYKDGLSGCFTQINFFVTALIHHRSLYFKIKLVNTKSQSLYSIQL